MKVLLTHSYFLQFDKKQIKNAAPYPPLATLYVASLLRAKGHELRLADLQIDGRPDDITGYIELFRPDVIIICDDSFNYLTKMCLTNMREAAFRMQEIAAARKVTVIVSSSDAADHPEDYLSRGASFVAIGEAEQTITELLDKLNEGKEADPVHVNGLAYIKDDGMLKTAPRKVMKELDALPPPAWDLADLDKYRKVWLRHHGFFSINLVTTRGCPFKCNWCAKPVYGNRYNSHSPAYIHNILLSLQRTAGYSHVWFADDIFGLKPDWISEFASLVKSSGIKFRYKIQSRADLLTNEDVVKQLAGSGCDEVWLGAESGSQKILDAMDKGTTIEQIACATTLLRKYNIRPCFFLQFGYSGETLEDIAKTMHLIEELKPSDIGVSVSYPLPGTKFYERVKEELGAKRNWTDSDDLSMMFTGRYRPGFYRKLQRFMHYRFRAASIFEGLRQGRINRKTMLLPYYLMRKKFLAFKLEAQEPEFSRAIMNTNTFL